MPVLSRSLLRLPKRFDSAKRTAFINRHGFIPDAEDIGYTIFMKSLILTSAFIVGTSIYSYYYNTKVQVEYQETPLNNRLSEEISEFRNRKFYSTWYMPWRALQLIIGNRFDKFEYVEYKRETVNAKDGEKLALDWAWLSARNEEKNDPSLPIVVVLPGATGTSGANYVKVQVNALRNNGFRTVVANQRGSVMPQVTPNFFNLTHLQEDFDSIFTHIREKYPDSNIYLMGFSMGACVALKYTATNENGKKWVKGVASVGNPFDFRKSVDSLKLWRNALYNYHITQKLKERFQNVVGQLEEHYSRGGEKIVSEKVNSSWCLSSFDREFTHKLLNGHSPEHYYDKVSCVEDVDKLHQPVLVINSKDDPLSRFSHVPVEKMKQLKNYFLAFTPKGAHIEFFVNFRRRRVNSSVEC